MDDQKEEIENLRKQIKSLKIGLMLTQISTIVFTIILGRQCLRSIQNYHYLLRQMSMCLEYVKMENPVCGCNSWIPAIRKEVCCGNC